jgi:hypothetical protein
VPCTASQEVEHAARVIHFPRMSDHPVIELLIRTRWWASPAVYLPLCATIVGAHRLARGGIVLLPHLAVAWLLAPACRGPRR